MVAFKAFKDIEIPSFVAGHGFKDASWGNDACARMMLEIAPDTFLSLWVDYGEMDKREVGGSRFFMSVEWPSGTATEIWGAEEEDTAAYLFQNFMDNFRIAKADGFELVQTGGDTLGFRNAKETYVGDGFQLTEPANDKTWEATDSRHDVSPVMSLWDALRWA